MLVLSVQQSESVTVLIVFSGSIMPNTSETPWTIACQAPLYGIFQARILVWVVISSSRGSSRLRHQTLISCVYCIAGRFFTCWAIWKVKHNVDKRLKL